MRMGVSAYGFSLSFMWLCKGLISSAYNCTIQESYCYDTPVSLASFICPTRGRYSHPKYNWLYYQCNHSNPRPCICTCPMGKMFDSKSGLCVKKSKLDIFEETNIIGKIKDNRDHFNSYDKVLGSTRIMSPDQEASTASELTSGYRILESGDPQEAVVLSDMSLFPAWAIALVVLIGVILMVLVVLIVY